MAGEGMRCRGACMAEGDMYSRGRGHAWWGICMAGGVCGGGIAWQGGMCGRGMCVAGETVTAAGGMHPTEMHSCYFSFLL